MGESRAGKDQQGTRVSAMPYTGSRIRAAQGAAELDKGSHGWSGGPGVVQSQQQQSHQSGYLGF